MRNEFVLVHVLCDGSDKRVAIVPAKADPALLGKLRAKKRPDHAHWEDDDDDELQQALWNGTVAEMKTNL